MTSVWGVSAVAILDCSLTVYACGQQKALPCWPTVLQQTVTTHKQLCTSSRGIDPLWGENGSNLYNSNELRLSHAHLCSEHFAECDFVNFMRNTKWGLLQSGICRAVHWVTDLEQIPARISKNKPANHNSPTDYCLQQRSRRLQSCGAQSKNNCANDKQMESQTNLN